MDAQPNAAPATTPPAPAATATDTSNERPLAAVAYILLWLTGLIILLTSKPEEKYKRWHAIHAIAIGIAVTALQIILNILSVAILPMFVMFNLLSGILSLLTLVLIVVLAVKAYQGQKMRIPMLADFADKHA